VALILLDPQTAGIDADQPGHDQRPAFLPTIPGLIEHIGGGDPMALSSSMTVAGQLVDVSPLSTLGALSRRIAGGDQCAPRLQSAARLGCVNGVCRSVRLLVAVRGVIG